MCLIKHAKLHDTLSQPNLITIYIEAFRLTWITYNKFAPTEVQWNDIKGETDKLLTEIIIKKQWDTINPCFEALNIYNIQQNDIRKGVDTIVKKL